VKISAVLLLSLLGMGSSSAAVTWLTPQWASPTETAAYERPSTESEPKTESATNVTVAAAEALTPNFSVTGPLRLDGRLGHAQLPADRENETFVLVEVGASDRVAIDARAPVNLSIVIDRSGSMKGRRLDNAIAAARGMLSRLRPDDTVSVIAYDNDAELLVAPTTVAGIDRFAFERTLAALRGGGNTCISCGIDLARSQIRRRRRDAINRILLLSDGVANRGLTRPAQFRDLGDQTRRERTAVASIGVDLDYDERTLFALSQASNGHHYFVENPSDLPAVFDREARDLMGTIADRVDVEVELGEGVELLEVIARGHRREREGVVISFGSFNAGDEKSALLRVRLAPGRGDRPVAEVRLAYRDLADDRDQSSAGALGLVLDPEQTRVARLDPRVEERLGRKDTLDALLSANSAFADGNLAVAQRELDEARGRIQQRKLRSGSTRGTKVDRDFDRQLQALGSAQISFDEAVADAPARAPKAASTSRKGKKAIRNNTASANPFG